MAAQDKKIGSLTEWVYENIVGTANIVVANAGANYRIVLSTLKQYVLGNRVIGGAGSNDIPTNGGNQILINKRLNEPSFNSDVQLNSNVTATQMNHLSGLSTNVNQALTNLDGYIATVENDLGNLYSTVQALQADKIYSIGRGVPYGEASIKIEASSMSNEDIDPYSLSISVYEQTSSNTMTLLNLSNINIVTSDNILSDITIADVVPNRAYRIVIRYRLASGMGIG